MVEKLAVFGIHIKSIKTEVLSIKID
jgi:hypothetical protein